jgi:hypothetical protein
MKRNIYFFLSTIFFYTVPGICQTGPGGVGNSASVPFWVDANAISQLSGTTVSSWSDLSGNGNNFAQATSSRRPTFQDGIINGLPALRFDGVNDYLASGAVSAMETSQRSWYAVCQPITIKVGGVCGSQYSGISAQKALFNTAVVTNGGSRYYTYSRFTTGVTPISTATINTNPTYLSTIVGNSGYSTFQNGGLVGTESGAPLAPTTHVESRIGRHSSANHHFSGYISEHFHFTFELNTCQRTIVDNYISSKYGLAIGTTDFYAHEGTGHNLGLVGIGRISGNTHTDAQGAGIMQIFNATSLDVDGDVIMIAHNDEATTSNNTNIPAAFGASNGRVMDRIWRIDYSGTPGSFDLTVHMDGINFGASNNDYVLIYDTDDDFTSGATTVVPTSVVGDKITFTALSSAIIADGGYFTIASINGIISINGGGDWNNTASWNCACIPSGSRNPTITDGNPITLTSDIDITDVEIESASSLTIDDDVFLDIYGDLQADGSLIGSAAGLNFLGTTGTQNITVGGTFNIGYIEASNIDGFVWSGNDVVLVLALYPELGNFDVSGLNSFTLRSNSSQTAYVAEGNSNSSLTGSFSVQRFLPGGNADWRDITSPNLTADFTDWDDDLIISGEDPLFTDGCAFGTECFHSIKRWNSINQEYEDITDPTEALVSYVGYEVFLGDDLSTFNDTTYTVTGELRTFNDVSLACRPLWNLYGNIYASQIDWDDMTRDPNIGNFYYIYDTQSGAFEYYDGDNPGTSPLGDIIASGQAIWVHNAGASNEDLTFSQSVKTEDVPTFIRSTEGADNKFNVSLKGPSKNYHTNSNVIFTSNNRGSTGLSGIPTLITEHQKAPALFFIVEDEKMRSARVLPGRDDVKVQMGMQFFEDGMHEISFSNNDLFRVYEYVYLIDKVSGKMLLVDESTSLRFEAKKQKDQDFRFELLFTNTNNDGFASTERLVDIYKFDNENIKFDLQLNQTAQNVNISIFNSVGQLMFIQDYQDMDSQILNKNVAEFAPGIYIVNVIIDGQKFVEKIVIE